MARFVVAPHLKSLSLDGSIDGVATLRKCAVVVDAYYSRNNRKPALASWTANTALGGKTWKHSTPFATTHLIVELAGLEGIWIVGKVIGSIV
jgi:hypothetical protein